MAKNKMFTIAQAARTLKLSKSLFIIQYLCHKSAIAEDS